MAKKLIALCMFSLLFSISSYGADPCSNANKQGELIFDAFKGVNPENIGGPDYYLKSGQLISRLQSICRNGKKLTSGDVISFLKGVNPSQWADIKSFHQVKSAQEVMKFLDEVGIKIGNSTELENRLNSFFAEGQIENPIIIVGYSPTVAVLTLAASNSTKQWLKPIPFDLKL